MESKKNDMEDLFDYSLKNYLSLEKLIFESVPMYEQNPTDHMKYLITNMCVIARGQINVLQDILPKVCRGQVFENYNESLNSKYNDIIEIEREILNKHQK